MGRAPCCSKGGLHRGSWSTKEDTLLTNFIQAHGEGQWRTLPQRAGLLRCGKSCRLRWLNYLRPGIKRGNITPEEEDLIIRLQSLLGNRWSLIAARLPGRTDNEIKNHWNTHLLKRLKEEGIEPKSRKHISKRLKEPERKTNKAIREQKGGKQPEKPKKKNIDSDGSQKEEVTMGKVHLPKPIRVSSGFIAGCNSVRSPGTDNGGSVGSSSQKQQVADKEAKTKVSYIPRSLSQLGDAVSYVSDQSIHLGDDGVDTLLLDDCYLSLPDDTLLEQVYDEYLRLLSS